MAGWWCGRDGNPAARLPLPTTSLPAKPGLFHRLGSPAATASNTLQRELDCFFSPPSSPQAYRLRCRATGALGAVQREAAAFTHGAWQAGQGPRPDDAYLDGRGPPSLLR